MIQKISFLVVLSFLTIKGLTQKRSFVPELSGKKYLTSAYPSINLNYNVLRTYSKSSFHEYFENNYNSKFGQESYSVGFNIAGPIIFARALNYGKKKHFDGHTGVHYQFTNSFEPNDTTSYSFKAIHFNFMLGNDLLFFWDNIDLPLRIGFDGGMAFLKNNNIRNRNPLLSVVAQSELRFVLRRIVLGSKLEIGYDITSKKWKPKKNGVNNELSFKNHYYSLQFSIGYNLLKPRRKMKKNRRSR